MDKLQVLPKELEKTVNESNITDLTKAEQIAVNYAPFMHQVAEQTALLKKLKKGVPEDVENAKRIRIDLGKIAQAVGRQKKTDKEVILLEARFVDALYNTVNGAARLTQNEAEDIEKHFEQLEQEKKHKLAEKRAKKLLEFEATDVHGLGEMTEKMFDFFLVGAKANYEAKIAAEKKVKQEREESRRLDERYHGRSLETGPYVHLMDGTRDIRTMEDSEYQLYLLELKALKKRDQDKFEAEKLHNHRKDLLIPYWGQMSDTQRKENYAEHPDKVFNAALASFRKQKEIDDNKTEALEVEARAQIKENERLEAQIQADKEKKRKEEQEAEKQRRTLDLAPDKEKLTSWIQTTEMDMPTLKSKESEKVADEIQHRFFGFKSWALKEIEKLN